MKEGERVRQAGREGERDRAISRCICLMRQMKSVCLGGALAAGKKEREPVCSALFLSGFLSLSPRSVYLIVPVIWPFHQYVF